MASHKLPPVVQGDDREAVNSCEKAIAALNLSIRIKASSPRSSTEPYSPLISPPCTSFQNNPSTIPSDPSTPCSKELREELSILVKEAADYIPQVLDDAEGVKKDVERACHSQVDYETSRRFADHPSAEQIELAANAARQMTRVRHLSAQEHVLIQETYASATQLNALLKAILSTRPSDGAVSGMGDEEKIQENIHRILQLRVRLLRSHKEMIDSMAEIWRAYTKYQQVVTELYDSVGRSYTERITELTELLAERRA